MNNGRLEQLADPQTLYHRPATLFAATFVGAGSFIDATIVGVRDGRAEVDAQGIRFEAADTRVDRDGQSRVLLNGGASSDREETIR